MNESESEFALMILGLLFTVAQEAFKAGSDRAKQDAALMKAEEALYQIRMQTKFGQR